MLKRIMVIFAGLAALVIIGLVTLAYSKDARLYTIKAISESGMSVQKDISYGQNPRHKLDIYSPAEANMTGPIVIYYYGGGWKSGDKDLYHFIGAALADKGITTIIPNYRLYPEVKFPDFINDSALAYKWVSENYIKGKKPRPIIVMGHSAGAHIGAMLSYNKAYLQNISAEIPRPAAFIGLAGPYAFDPTTWSTTKEIFETAQSADQARPVTFADNTSPPTLLFHGLEDTTVKLWNAKTLIEKLKQNQINSKLVELPGIGHIGIVTSIARPLRWRTSVLADILTFIKEVEP